MPNTTNAEYTAHQNSHGDITNLQASHAFAITPDDDNDLSHVCNFHVGGDGDITVDMAGGETNVLFSNLKGGYPYPYLIKRVRATGTTATGIVGIY